MTIVNFTPFAAAALAAPFLLGAPARATTLHLTEADSGQSFVARRGDIIEARLRENPSTGYSWAQQGAAPGLKLFGRSAVRGAAMPGAPGAAIFRFRAARVGPTALSLVYMRSWEKGQPPAQTFSARFDIRP
ncbi:inhibitor of cysteine peptidase [Rhodoblastus acidophilus]|uniref:protease inhibitor I42 family protein n=1 Tax=Rhodoblastus acidophilus TaxID=1074 RepID=UPI002224894B|nr:protease inhibitor I42 family protein [Rhodoblastus acidophilus]MCW2318275.1 inhibitor of cysteine peptidase [Rhodoblastus acidophilus]